MSQPLHTPIGAENPSGIENPEQLQQEIDNLLDTYGGRYGYTKHEGKYYPVIGNWRVDLPSETQEELMQNIHILNFLTEFNPSLEPEQMREGIHLIQRLLSFYQENNYTGKLYPAESDWSKGKSRPIIDLRVDNRSGVTEFFLGDTTFLTQETMRKILPAFDTRDMTHTKRLADFLNYMIERKVA